MFQEIQAFSTFCVNTENHLHICVTHPGLQYFVIDSRLPAPGAEIDAEIMTADDNSFPWRKFLPFSQQRFMFFCFSIPTLVASVQA